MGVYQYSKYTSPLNSPFNPRCDCKLKKSKRRGISSIADQKPIMSGRETTTGKQKVIKTSNTSSASFLVEFPPFFSSDDENSDHSPSNASSYPSAVIQQFIQELQVLINNHCNTTMSSNHPL